MTCENPLQLESGECCPRCPDDPCNLISNTTDSGKPCSYKGHNYLSGQLFIDSSNRCTTCACKVSSYFFLLQNTKKKHCFII